MTKTRIIPARLERAFTMAKKPVKFRFKKSCTEVGFSMQGFLECLGKLPSNFQRKMRECEKDSGFCMSV